MKKTHSKEVKQAAIDKLHERGVTIHAIAEIVYQMQAPYTVDLTIETCVSSVERVLEKRELQHAILVGAELD
ncbi:phosphatidylglycerophosphatase, partial [Exiguobacterium indicum]